jgi:outer membrane protein TolC
MRKLFILLIIICTNIFCKAQQENSTVIPVEDFIEKVKQHHPLAKVAGIAVDKAKANLLSAKGAFDPVLELDARQKTFDTKNYYTYNNAEIKIPLPIGDVKTGIERNGGQFLESEITSGRSSYAGVEFPLAKGLLIDKRRAFLKQANIAVQQTNEQRKALLNDLLLDAYESYYQWAGNYRLYNIFSDYVKVSSDRLRLIKISQLNGDRAAMDTTEAYTQLQNFIILQADAQMKMMSTKYMLNNFIWAADGRPQNISENIVPDTTLISATVNTKALLDIIQIATTQNPILQQYKFKIDALQVDRKLKFQELLPVVNLKGNILSKDFYAFKNTGAAYLENNNYWGIDIKIPLRFREGRGAYRMAKLKILESDWELKQKTWETENKVKDYYNQFVLIQKQLEVANDAYKNFSSLLRNETLRFTNGESSLFLVNTRENKVLEMQQKIIELQVKLLKAKYGLDWAAGQLQ